MSYPETPLEAALAYARRGWSVFPLVPGAKVPDVPRGFLSATTDEATIRNWWAVKPSRGVGIALAASHLVAVDIDSSEGHGGIDGHDTLERIEAEHGLNCMDSNAIQETPSGGEHRLYANPDSLSFPAKFFPDKGNIDLKSSGYICAYPSTRSDYGGQRYEWSLDGDPLEHDEPITPLPAWMAETLARKPQAPAGAKGLTPDSGVVLVTQQEWADVCSALASLSSDDREDWVQVGMALKATHHPDAYGLWDRWSAESSKYNPEDCRRVWSSFHDRGFGGVSIKSVFALARDKSNWNGLKPEERQIFEAQKAQDAERVQYANAPAQAQAQPEDDDYEIESLDDLEERAKKLRFVVDCYLPSDSIGCVYGTSGSGKSFVAIDLALHVATGLDWCGRRAHQGEVLYIASEGAAGLIKRIKAWLKVHPEQKGAVVKNFHFFTKTVALRDEAEYVRRKIDKKSFKPALIVVDTLSQTFTGEENSASDMAAYIRSIEKSLREPYGACVMLVHHSGKDSGKGARGSSALRANTSFLYEVTRNGTDMSNQVECVHQKDFELPAVKVFRWIRESLGTDAQGLPSTSVRLEPYGAHGAPGSAVYKQKDASALTKYERSLLDSIHASDDLEAVRKGFVDEVAEDCLKADPGLDRAQARSRGRTAFSRALEGLERKNFARASGGKVFAIDGFVADPECPF